MPKVFTLSPALGSAVDPVNLPGVDEVSVTTLVDNVFDALLASSAGVTRVGFGTTGRVDAPQFTSGEVRAGHKKIRPGTLQFAQA